MPDNQQYQVPIPLLDYWDSAEVAEWELNFFFEHLHFSAFVGHDLTMDDVRTTAQEFAVKDHSQLEAFIFFIISHFFYNTYKNITVCK